jgi:hypothetical protein
MISPTFLAPASSNKDFPIYNHYGFCHGKGGYLDSFEGLFEGEGHATADDEGVYFGDEVVDQLDFIGHFCTSEDGEEGAFRLFKCFGKIFEFFLHEKT